MLRSFFHGGNTGSNPVGDAKPFQHLDEFALIMGRHKKAQQQACFSRSWAAILKIFRIYLHFLGNKKAQRGESVSGRCRAAEPSVITAKAANEYHFKTGQRRAHGGTPMFYPVDCDSGKSN